MTEIILLPTPPELEAERAQWEAETYDREYAKVKQLRQLLYAQQSDPIFFKYQRGEATEQQWLDAIEAVNAANPYPDPADYEPTAS